MNQDELYHYGIKGMKWGVRRQKIASKGDTVPKGTSRKGYGIRTHVGKGGSTRKYTRDMYRTQVTLNGKTMKEHASNARQSAQAKIQQTKQKLSTPEAKAKIDKAAKTAKVGAAVAGAALAAYGGYKLNKYARDTNYQYRMQQGKEYAKDLVKQGFVDEIITDKTYSWDATPAYRMAAEAARNTAKSDKLPTAIANTIRYKRLYE